MVRAIRQKKLSERFKDNLNNFRLFAFLGVMALVIGLTYYLTTKSQDFRQHAAELSTEFGFNTHLSASNNNLDINFLKANVDDLASHGQKWIRMNVIQWEVATETGATASGTNKLNWNEANLAIFDQGIDYARNHGLKIFLVAGVTGLGQGLPQDQYEVLNSEFFNFLSTRWQGKIAVWQIFNEADVHKYVDYVALPSGLDSTYLSNLSKVLHVVKTTIKQNDPNSLITTNVSGYPMGDPIVAQWYKFYDAIIADLDVTTIDVYPGKTIDEINKLDARVNNLQARYNKDVYVGEVGICTDVPGYMTAEDQSVYLKRSIDILKMSKAKAIMIYEIQDEATPKAGATESELCEGSFGIKKFDGTKKSSYDTIMNVMQPLPSTTPTFIPTNTPTPTTIPVATNTPIPTKAPTPTPAPNTGLLRVVTSPATAATIKIVTYPYGKIVSTTTWSVDWKPLTPGSYYIVFSYPRTVGLITPTSKTFTIYKGHTTEITGNFTTGKTTVVYK